MSIILGLNCNHADSSACIIKNGKLVFCRDEVKKIRYEAKVLSEYLDYKDTLEWFNRKLLARI